MDGMFWWDTKKDDGCVNGMLKVSVEARKWYLKTDVKVRLKRLILHHGGLDEVNQLWKRLNIIKHDFGEETGSLIVNQAVLEVETEFGDPEWEETINGKIARIREGLDDDSVRMI